MTINRRTRSEGDFSRATEACSALGSLTAAALLITLTGCGGESAQAVAETEPSVPWKWEPDDPELAAGKEVYEKTCSLCHNEGEEGAPRLTHAAEWETRSAKGIDTLVDHAIQGFAGEAGEMPARGGNDSYTDAEISSAVRFMIAAPK